MSPHHDHISQFTSQGLHLNRLTLTSSEILTTSMDTALTSHGPEKNRIIMDGGGRQT